MLGKLQPPVSSLALGDAAAAAAAAALDNEELVRQLKYVVQVQHDCIEELKQQLNVSLYLSGGPLHSTSDSEALLKLQKENEQQRLTISSLRAEVADLKTANETLKKANRRNREILRQQQGSPMPPLPFPPDTRAVSVEPGYPYLSSRSPTPSVGPGGVGGVGGGGGGGGAAAQRAGLPQSARGPSRASTPATLLGGSGGGGGGGGGGPAPVVASRMDRFLGALPAFWKQLESPTGVLRALVEVTSRILSDVPNVRITLYAVDLWLRSVVELDPDRAPIIYYFGQGKTQLQVVGNKTGAEAPIFPNLQCFPLITKHSAALAIQVRSRLLGVIQVSYVSGGSGVGGGSGSNSNVANSLTSPGAPKILAKQLKEQGLQEAQTESLTDSAVGYLRAVCNFSASMLVQIERSQGQQLLNDRLLSAMDLVVEISKAKNLQDFEQRLRQHLMELFNVTSVRILWFDVDRRCLLASAWVLRQEPIVHSLEKGVVGMVARRQQVLHIPSISKNAIVDVVADGIQRPGGKYISGQASMLLGPLLAEVPVTRGGGSNGSDNNSKSGNANVNGNTNNSSSNTNHNDDDDLGATSAKPAGLASDSSPDGDGNNASTTTTSAATASASKARKPSPAESYRLMGVVQLLERRNRNSKTAALGFQLPGASEFSQEDQNLFQQLLRGCANAAFKTWKMEEVKAQHAGTPSSLSRLLGGK